MTDTNVAMTQIADASIVQADTLPMNIKVGKAYQVKGGDVIVITGKSQVCDAFNLDYDPAALDQTDWVFYGSNSNIYTEEGKCIQQKKSRLSLSNPDVIDEIVPAGFLESLELKTGENYFTKDGYVVTIIALLPTLTPHYNQTVILCMAEAYHVGATSSVYTFNGKGVYGYNQEGRSTPSDLIGIVPKKISATQKES